MDNQNKHSKYDKFVGTVLDEKYEITDVVGIGGTAFVLKANDLKMNRVVAIKILNDENASDERSVRRFVNESKAVAMLSHPNIVNIFDVAFDEPLKYIVMEYIDGITLKSYILKKGKLPFDEALGIVEQILKALSHAHEMGIVHRDIKPQNVILLPNGQIKVTDFGIAKLPNSETISLSDKAMGTVYYISPEQASGEPTDFRTDIYSTGIMLYEMITGRLPFDADTPLAIAMMQVNNAPPEPRKINPDIPEGLEQITLKAIRKEPSERFKSAKSMLRSISIFKANPNVIFKDKSENVEVAVQEQDKLPEKKKKALPPEKDGELEDHAPHPKLTKPRVKTKKAKRTMFPIIFGVSAAFFLVLLVSGVIVLTTFLKTQTRDMSVTLTVPQLVGQIYGNSLEAQLHEENFRISSTEYVYNTDYAENTIISQSPVSGTRKKIANESLLCDISVVISRGKQTIKMPDVTISEYRSARIELINLGLSVKVEHIYDDAVLEGFVISTSVAPGADVAIGDVVTLYVSDGQKIEYTTMISVVGQSLAGARASLELNGFVVGKITREPSMTDTGYIISQSVEPGIKCAKKYTVVNLVVSIKYTEEYIQKLEEEERLKREEEERLKLEEERLKREEEERLKLEEEERLKREEEERLKLEEEERLKREEEERLKNEDGGNETETSPADNPDSQDENNSSGNS